MKKLILFGVAIGALLIGGLLFIQNINVNRIGANQYYTQIEGQGKKLVGKADNGETFISYEYELPAFNKKGQEKTLTFTSHKQLRDKAYLCLFVKDGKGVTSYQEVTKKELPEKAKID
ncbi:YxeA family protein [Peribacillus alkalitolerans]|uniref:YxeA family protein n=1 Tax=Peribacillus alkalitolerans TaxID=1550385 RepID=UPI0013D809A9|nr:YxeA family protein [Peribacillus alkalitolerans]